VRTRRLPLNYPVVILACCLSFSLLPIAGAWSPPTADAQGPAAISGLHVVGNQIRNGAGQPVRLLGVNRSGTEYACVQGWGIFDGPSDAASLLPIVAWRANAVRIPLNEDCWLAINGVPAAYGGASYQAAIASYVAALNAAGLVAILELHWGAPGTQKATAQTPMPDRDHSITFWSQVANAYKSNSSVIFELFNEPYPDSNQNTPAGWQCWRDGGTCPGVDYQAAGMQELVTAVRSTGATNIILLGGLQYSNALSQWLTYKPNDPTGNLGAAWHVYNFNLCNNVTCYDTTAGPVAQQVPLVTTEIGEDDGGHGFIDPLMSWLDGRGQAYLAWTWDTWGCGNAPVLISSYNGAPCQTFGQGYKDHLAAVSTTLPPASTPTPTAATLPCSVGDINCDGIVDVRDYGLWRQSFGSTNCGNPNDLNLDCIVDIRDYGVWRQNFGRTGGAGGPGSGPSSAPTASAPRSGATPSRTPTPSPTATPSRAQDRR
jgi:Cellulase (glycosyl hydrolase family 5)